MDLQIRFRLFHNFSRILQQHLLEVFKYDSTLTDKTKEEDFETNQLKIAYATARTLCSYHLGKTELYFDTIASLLSHLNFITKNGNDYLQLYSSRLERLRDFSKTTRIGELAQGINYLFVQERLNYPYIIDFHLFYGIIYKKSSKGKRTPDFVTLNRDFSSTGLFESKGTTYKSRITGKYGMLNKALKQLRSILQPCVKDLIPVCSFFENDLNNRSSSINYTNITTDCVPYSDITLRIFRQHYSSWFYLFGDFGRSNQLLEPEGFTGLIDDARYELGTDDNKNEVYWINWPFESFLKNPLANYYVEFYADFIHFTSVKFGIYEKVIDRLLTNNISEIIDYPIESNEQYLKFADGTLIKIDS